MSFLLLLAGPQQSYSEDTVKGNAETAETLTVSKSQHHRPLYYHAIVPVSQLCGGSRTFGVIASAVAAAI
jgi:hypothetical protein